MATQKSLDIAYMACARAIAALSKAERKKVGAILVAENSKGIIAEGYNGTPKGFDNVCEILAEGIDVNTHDNTYVGPHIRLITKPEVLHAESNAIAKVAKSTNSSERSTLYVTCSPCYECSKLIIQAGIVRVVYDEEYRITDGLDLLKKAGVKVEKLCSGTNDLQSS